MIRLGILQRLGKSGVYYVLEKWSLRLRGGGEVERASGKSVFLSVNNEYW